MSNRQNQQSTHNKKTGHSSSKPHLLFVVLGLMLVAGAYGAYAWLGNGTSQQASTASRDVTADRTYDGASEGVTFPVPDNVPSEAIKNYALIVDTEEYKIRKDDASNSYLVTLYAIINRPSQYDLYQQQLADYKQQALRYLTDQGVDVKKVTIEYEPSEAENL